MALKRPYLYRDFSQIKKKAAIKNQLKSNRVLRLIYGDVNLSSNLFFQEIDKLINFWAPLQVLLNTRKISQNKPCITKGTPKSLGTKNIFYWKMCRLKDPSKRNKTECKEKKIQIASASID